VPETGVKLPGLRSGGIFLWLILTPEMSKLLLDVTLERLFKVTEAPTETKVLGLHKNVC